MTVFVSINLLVLTFLVYPSLYPLIFMSILLCVCLSLFLSVFLSINLMLSPKMSVMTVGLMSVPILFVYLRLFRHSVWPSFCLHVILFVRHSVCPSFFLPVILSVRHSVYIFVWQLSFTSVLRRDCPCCISILSSQSSTLYTVCPRSSDPFYVISYFCHFFLDTLYFYIFSIYL